MPRNGDGLDTAKVKASSERLLLNAGAKICDWLPVIEQTTPRALKAIADRALVLNALVQLAFKAPPTFIKQWIVNNGLSNALAKSELFILDNPDKPLSANKRDQLLWSIESLWTLMWVCGRVSEMRLDEPAGNELAAMFPNLRTNESAEVFYPILEMQSYARLYEMRDLIYRAHWYVRDGQLNGYCTEPFSMDIIMERRKAIEWSCDDQQDWDETNDNT